MMTQEQIETNAFKKGLREADKLPGDLCSELRKELMKGLGITTYQALWARAIGDVSHTEYERAGMERTFEKYGITDPWGL